MKRAEGGAARTSPLSLPGENGLSRRLGLGLMVLYGIGVMIGAGVYVLMGAVAAHAGPWTPLAFVLAGAVAAPTALGYAELSSRIPETAGVAAYVERGLGLRRLALAVGLAIVVSGVISAAAVLRGGVGYLLRLADVPEAAAIACLGVALVLVAGAGVVKSLAMAGLFTLIEVTGLMMVVGAGFAAPPAIDLAGLPPPHWPGLAMAVMLAFFAYLGFEDMVNMAEETRRPERTMPRAILLALTVTAAIYALVAVASLRAVPVADLASSSSPLVLVWQAGFGGSGGILAAIAVVAALNGVLAQILMASRMLFGLGRRSAGLGFLHHVSPRWHTPLRATLLVGGALIAAALTLPVAHLAFWATQVLLTSFVVVNISLIWLKRKEPEAPFSVPVFVPWLGAVMSLMVLAASWGGAG